MIRFDFFRKGQTNVTVEDGPEMEWDNSTLNITVNPLESVSMSSDSWPFYFTDVLRLKLVGAIGEWIM